MKKKPDTNNRPYIRGRFTYTYMDDDGDLYRIENGVPISMKDDMNRLNEIARVVLPGRPQPNGDGK